MSDLLLLVDSPDRGAENMRRDVNLLEACAAGRIAGAVRIYSFSPPCLSLGRLQDERDVDIAACARDGVDVVRRPSGGRAVLHEREVTYAVVCRTTDPQLGGRVLESCSRIHTAISRGLALLGVTTEARSASREERVAARQRAEFADCFAKPSPHELVDTAGRKLVGSAQARKGGALLQHGSILLEPHRAGVYLARGGGLEASSSLRHLLGKPLHRDLLIDALVRGFQGVLGARLRT